MEINEIIKAHNKLNEMFGFGKKKEDPLKDLSTEERAEYDELAAIADDPELNIEKRIAQAKHNAGLTPEEKAAEAAERRAAEVARVKEKLKFDMSPMGQLQRQKDADTQAKDRSDSHQSALDRHNAEVERLSTNLQIGNIRFTPHQMDQMRAQLAALQAKQW